jgi:hypothetical protein
MASTGFLIAVAAYCPSNAGSTLLSFFQSLAVGVEN